MALPSGVTTCDVTLGPVLDAAGNLADLSATVHAVLPSGLQHIIWTGDTAQEQLRTAKSPMPNGTDTTTCVLALPVVDQTGWETPGDASTNPEAITGWYYLLTGNALWPGTKEKHLFQIPFQPLTGMTALALNPFKQSEEGAVVSPGFTAPTGFVSSIGGHAGAIDLTDLASWLDLSLDAGLATDIEDTGTPVGAAVATAAVAAAADR